VVLGFVFDWLLRTFVARRYGWYLVTK